MGFYRRLGVGRDDRSRDRAAIHSRRPAVPQDPAHVASADHPIPVRILVAGIGNIFLGDDAFGSEVAGVLAHMRWPAHIHVEDFGIRSYDLAYALMDAGAAILIDAVPRGHPPGTVYLIEPNTDNLGDGMIDAHAMNPVAVLQLVRTLGGTTGRIYLVG